MYTVGIDTGGTFTDAFISWESGFATVKVETTPHDLTVCFDDAVTASAQAVGLEYDELLALTDVIRFSSTIATNTVLTGTGPKLGLLVTRGSRQDLYGAAREELFRLIRPHMIAEVDEEMAADGTVSKGPNVDDVNQVVRQLLERGARILVISLAHASANPSNERAVKAAIDESYPRHYLGAVPVLLSTEVSSSAHDAARTASAVVNAYVHKKLATSLYRAEDQIRAHGFRRPLLVVTTDGGVTRVAKTRALSTYQSGPTSGIYASARLCEATGIEAALTADVGGTSTDLGLIVGGRPVRRQQIDVGGIPVLQRSVELTSLGVGGGSLARVVEGRVSVGPESAGATPGPCCFGLGGREPTPTDAWLVLGYLDPDFYLGGRKRLDRRVAVAAIQEQIAKPLGISLDDAALAIKEAAEESVAAGIEAMINRDEVREQLGGKQGQELAVVAYGGGGGILIPGVARRLGLSRVVLSRFSPVFSAFGVSSFDVRHTYEARMELNGKCLGAVLDSLAGAARADMRGEGFAEDETELNVCISTDEGRLVLDEASLDASMQADLPSGPPFVVTLTAVCPVAKASLPKEDEGKRVAMRKGTRRIVLTEGPSDVEVFARENLGKGSRIKGPALIEAADTTYLIPPGIKCTIDVFGSAHLSEESAR